LDGFGESELVSTKVEDSGISGDEDVTQDELNGESFGSLESRDALVRSSIGSGDDDNVIVSGEGESVSVDDERDGGQFAALRAVDGAIRASTDLLVQFVERLQGTDDQRCSSIGDGRAGDAQRLAGDQNFAQFELPVGIRGNWDISKGTREASGIDLAEGEFTARISAVPFVQPESEQWLGDKSLRDEVVPDRSSVVNGNGIESHSEDTVESSVDESVAGLFHGFGEVLVFDVESSNVHSVLTDETSQRPGSVLDGESSSIRHVGGRFGTVIFVMGLASFVGCRAFGGWDPQVGGTSVEED